MVYFVSKQTRFPTEGIQCISVEESLRLLEPLKVVGLDTETEGFSPFIKKLLLVQLGCKEFQVVIDTTTIDIRLYKEYLESDRLFLGWNLKFDLKFLFYHGIVPRNVYDGYLMEKAIWQGWPSGMHSLSLKSAGEHYCGVELDKSVRGKIIWSKTLSDDIIFYAADDVKYLEEIREKQMQIFKDRGQERFLEIDVENKAVLPIAYFEFCGVKLDENKWRLKMEKDTKELSSSESALNSWVESHYPDDPRFCKKDLQGDLWEGYNTNPKCIINWNSAKQVIPLFETEGFNLLTKDKKTGQMKKSVDATIIEGQIDKSSISRPYLAYKAAQKVVSTYGQNVLDLINPVTGRIHTNFNQIGTDTFRLSSGGGEDTEVTPGRKVPLINLQNMPSDKDTREAFVAEEGNSFISIDFSGEESVVLANISKDKAMIELFTTGCGDLHSLVAKMIYPEQLADIPVEMVKKVRPDLRKSAKSPEFTLAYGGNENTLAMKDHIPMEEAQVIVANYFKGFPGVKTYQDNARRDVMQKGYIDECPEVGYRTYIYDFKEMKDAAEKFKEPGFWDTYRKLKTENPQHPTVQLVRWYFKRKSATERQGVNYRIQSRGSAIFKIAAVNFFKWIVDNNLFGVVKMCIPVHDEFDVEAPKEIAEEVALKLKECMVNAGKFICRIVPLDAEISYNKDGSLPDHWVH